MAVGLILLAGLMLEAPAAGPETILWFGAQEPTDLDQASLLQAVAVYTRDLRLSVRAVPQTRIAPTPAGAAHAVSLLREGAARLAFWCRGTAATGEVVLYTVDAAGALEAHAIQGIGAAGPELYRAIALKLRSVVADTEAPPGPAAAAGRAAPASAPGVPTGAADEHASAPKPQAPVASAPSPAPGPASRPAPGPASRPAPGLASSPARGPAPSPARAAETAVIVDGPAPPAPAAIRSRLTGAVGYRLVVPAGNAPLRQGLALEGDLAVARAAEISLGAELAPAGEGRVASGTVSLFDVPLRVGARLVRQRPRLWLGAGAFAGLHLLSARATGASGDQATTFTAAASAGAEALVRVPFARAMAGELRVLVEAIVPRTVFWVGGTPAIQLGTQVGLGLGLSFPGP